MKRTSSRIVKLGLLAALSLICVHLVSGNVCSITPRKIREATLKHDLLMMREAINNYTLDNHRPPQALEDLVEAHDLRELPVDPFTGKRNWDEQIGDVALSRRQTARGLYDVHSTSDQLDMNGAALYTW
jgi:general secretion pathway protein G